MTAMETRRWLNPAQPQTLQIAVFLLYAGAAFLLFDLLRAAVFPLFWLAVVAASVAGGFGIANERKWGYGLGIAAAIAPFALRFWYLGNPIADSLITVMLDIALLALLLHPMSREYQKIWFK